MLICLPNFYYLSWYSLRRIFATSRFYYYCLILFFNLIHMAHSVLRIKTGKCCQNFFNNLPSFPPHLPLRVGTCNSKGLRNPRLQIQVMSFYQTKIRFWEWLIQSRRISFLVILHLLTAPACGKTMCIPFSHNKKYALEENGCFFLYSFSKLTYHQDLVTNAGSPKVRLEEGKEEPGTVTLARSRWRKGVGKGQSLGLSWQEV